IAGFGIIGSYVFGLIDTKMGTRFAILLSHICMLVSGILGMLKNPTLMFIGLILLAMFMGASSNYTVSAAVQYWRIEDFPSVFSAVNPIANLINAFGPTIVAALIGTTLGTPAVFIASGVAAIISIICCLLFKPARVKAYDDKYREAAGKPLDDVLVGRK
ncbi:MAG: MFS transporter, partial [Lachnospiraceae bacterium]|nr:MFS transporter [Lachnospiraceae bacterium]